LSLRDVKIGRVNRLRLKEPEKYKQSKSPKLSNVVIEEPDFLTPMDERGAFMKTLTELFALQLVSINGVELTPDEIYYYDERAGIYEFSGGLSREEAEERTFKIIRINN